MLTHPGTLHVWGEGDGVCEGKRERGTGNGYRITPRSAGALPGKILLRPGVCCFVPARIRETA